MNFKRFITVSCLLLVIHSLSASSFLEDTFIIIQDLKIQGNKKTKEAIVWRELDFQKGDTLLLDNYEKRIQRNYTNLLDTHLFNEVQIDTIHNEAHFYTIQVTVEERWRFWPWPVFDIVDQNFNVWWKDHHHDLDRAVYGITFHQYNFRGRNEGWDLDTHFGYRRKFRFTYNIPFINAKKTWGLVTRVGYTDNWETAYNTENNKQVFLRTEGKVIKTVGAALTFQYRKHLYATHYFHTRFHQVNIADTLASLNPDYLLNQQTQQSFIGLVYTFEYDFRDLEEYPLKGYYWRVSVKKEGVGIFKDLNTLQIEGNYSHYFQMSQNAYFAANIKYRKIFGREIPYYNSLRIGFGSNDLRGYELYAIDSQQYLFLRSHVRYRLWAHRFPHPLGWKKGRKFGVNVFIRLFGDIAWTQDRFFIHQESAKENHLNNGNLSATGLAFDVLIRENVLGSLEYTYNRHDKRAIIFLNFDLKWDKWSKI